MVEEENQVNLAGYEFIFTKLRILTNLQIYGEGGVDGINLSTLCGVPAGKRIYELATNYESATNLQI